MKPIGKRLGALVLVLCLMAVLLPLQADAASYYERVSGENRFETAFKVADEMKAELGVSQFQSIIIASGTNFADALSGSYLANVKSAPILLSYNDTYNNKAKDYIRANLAPGGTVYILGGYAAVPASMESGLEGFYIRRLAGSNRFETNLMILQEAGVPAGKQVLVCTGANFADSLSASATGLPILLVYNESGLLMDSQKNYLATLRSNFCIIGGSSAVGKGFANQLVVYGNVERLAGSNRFETSVLVAEEFFHEPKEAVLAYAWNYPDGLCGGPLAYAMGCPMILTMTGYETQADNFAQRYYIKQGKVLGSTGLISDGAAQMIFSVSSRNTGTRMRYDLGSAQDLEGSPYVLVLFVDDNETRWDEAAVSQAWDGKVMPALAFLEERAASWGVELKFQVGCYYTGMSSGITVKYDGIIERDVYNAYLNYDVVDHAARSLGFGSKEDLDRYIKSYAGENDIVYLVMVNKDGRCYAVPDDYNDGNDRVEHCMVFTHYENYEWEVPVSSVAHEILHLFGAEDYYDPYGEYPNRKALAEQWYPRDIMLTVYTDVSYNEIGGFTAYTVGWTDNIPSECNDPNWWN